MKKQGFFVLQLFFLMLIIFFITCKKPERKMLVSTGEVINISSNTAEASGSIIDLGEGAIEYGHCYSKTPNVSVLSLLKTTLGKPIGVGDFTSELTNLDPSTKYYIKAYLSNGNETVYGKEISFVTFACIAASASSDAATNIGTTTATLNGTVNANGSSTTVTFEYGLTTSYSNTVTATQSPLTGNSNTAVSADISGLNSGSFYHFRVKVVNCGGTDYGSDQIFTTLLPDIDGNIYNIVKIGSQTWMSENLKTTKYNDGTSIPLITNNTIWCNLTTHGYCLYNNDPTTYKATYGVLYNWYAVSYTTNGNKDLCPTGWHVPSDAEFTVLTDFLGGENVAGGKLKESGTAHWISPNTDATNESSFTALPGGYRDYDGTFTNVGMSGHWWSSTKNDTYDAWYRLMNYNHSYVYRGIVNKTFGLSVRCIRN